jgi:predicted dehydrogenase
MPRSASRRAFVRHALATGGILAVGEACAAERRTISPNERLNVAVIGVGGRGAGNLEGVGRENVVALCDVDADRLAKAKAGFPHARGFADFREMLAHTPNLDAVAVSTPDHTHAVAAVAAMKLGKHLYCEKPLAFTVKEVRRMREIAAEKRLVTQMGTQIHAGENYRRVVEIVRSGVLGKIERVHVYFAGRPPALKNCKPKAPPSGLAYDLWLGPASETPYIPEQGHFNWRYWWKFGNGVLGDFGCHYMDLAFWALDLGDATHVSAEGAKDHDGENDVPAKQKVDYDFPATDKRPAVALTWYHGGSKPKEAERFKMSNAVLFVGEHGMLAADYGSRHFHPADKFAGVKIEKSIPPSIGHHREWLQAIRTGGPTTCNFDYSGRLTETVLLGNAAFRGAPGQRLGWDAKTFALSGSSDAAKYLHYEYRKGWEI